jgi:hypothetical protein
MNQLLSRQHLSSHSQENRQAWQASIVLLHTISVRMKVTLLSAVTLLVAAIISSCGPVESGQTTPTSTPIERERKLLRSLSHNLLVLICTSSM